MYVMLLGALVVTALPLTLPTTVPQMAIALTVSGLAVAPWLAVGASTHRAVHAHR